MTDTSRKKPTGLIKNTKFTPTQPANTVQLKTEQIKKVKKTVVKNQDANIKVSRQTKIKLIF